VYLGRAYSDRFASTRPSENDRSHDDSPSVQSDRLLEDLTSCPQKNPVSRPKKKQGKKRGRAQEADRQSLSPNVISIDLHLPSSEARRKDTENYGDLHWGSSR
jgi:hypothetical protein